MAALFRAPKGTAKPPEKRVPKKSTKTAKDEP
jgi:hypothetical protein